MSRRLDDYLSSVERHLRHLPALVRENEVRELRSHLEQLRDDFAAQGQNPEMAAQSALDQFGDARSVWLGRRAWILSAVFLWFLAAPFLLGVTTFLHYIDAQPVPLVVWNVGFAIA